VGAALVRRLVRVAIRAGRPHGVTQSPALTYADAPSLPGPPTPPACRRA
jgi:hypothetical protein